MTLEELANRLDDGVTALERIAGSLERIEEALGVPDPDPEGES